MGNCQGDQAQTQTSGQVEVQQNLEKDVPVQVMERKLQEQSQIKMNGSRINVDNMNKEQNHFEEGDEFSSYHLDPEQFLIDPEVKRVRDEQTAFSVSEENQQEKGLAYDQYVKIQYPDSFLVYKGEWKDQKPYGLGVAFFGDGSHYQGYFYEGKLHGFGRIIKKGLVYEGNFHKERFHGKGTLSQQDEFTYTGEFQDHVFSGEGKYENLKDNYKYIGSYFQNKKNGFGTEWSNATKYEGYFKDDKYHTEDDQTSNLSWLSEGKQYIGQFKEGVQEGHGKTTYSSNKYYEGPYNQNLRHGVGKFVHNNANKNVYIGNFESGVQHGEGMYRNNDKQWIFGKWVSGKKKEKYDEDHLEKQLKRSSGTQQQFYEKMLQLKNEHSDE